MSHVCDGRDLSCLRCVAMAGRIATVRTAMTTDEQLDDIKRARIWTQLEDKLADAAPPRPKWPVAIGFAALAAAAAAVLAVLARSPRDADPAHLLSVPADTTVSSRIGPHTRAALVGPAQLELLGTPGDATWVRLRSGTLLAEFSGGSNRTLRVEAPGTLVEVVGTLFAVEVRGAETCTSVAHGRVRVTSAGGVVHVAGGERYCTGGAVHPIAADMRDALERHDAASTARATPSEASPANEPAVPSPAGGAPTPADRSASADLPTPGDPGVLDAPPAPRGPSPGAGAPPAAAPPPAGARQQGPRDPSPAGARQQGPRAPSPEVSAPAPIAPSTVDVRSRAPARQAVAPRAPPAESDPPIARSPGAAQRAIPPAVASGRPLPAESPAVASGRPLPAGSLAVASGRPSPAGSPVVASGRPLPTGGPAAAAGSSWPDRAPTRTPAASETRVPEPRPPAAPTADELYRAAETALAARNPAAADRALARLLAEQPGSPLVDQALYERARIAYQQRAWATARAQLARLAAIPGTLLAEPGRYLACRIAIEARDGEAASCLADYRNRFPRSPHDLEALALLVQLAHARAGCNSASALIGELARTYPRTTLAAAWRARCPEPR